MKTITVKYIQGLASFLDEENIMWELISIDELIKIHYHNAEDLFNIAFRFGKFYKEVENENIQN